MQTTDWTNYPGVTYNHDRGTACISHLGRCLPEEVPELYHLGKDSLPLYDVYTYLRSGDQMHVVPPHFVTLAAVRAAAQREVHTTLGGGAVRVEIRDVRRPIGGLVEVVLETRTRRA